MTVRAAYVKNGESRSVPMNEVLTATLQTVRMSTSTEGPVFWTRTGEPYRIIPHGVYARGTLGREGRFYLP